MINYKEKQTYKNLPINDSNSNMKYVGLKKKYI